MARIDRNADNSQRLRRNMQRLAALVTAAETPMGTIDGVNDDFVVPGDIGDKTVLVFVDGLLMREGASNDYTISGQTLTFRPGAVPQTGDWIRVIVLR